MSAFMKIPLLLGCLFITAGCQHNSYPCDRVIDIDGNEYPVVQIGNQLWMAENLHVTHYRNGDSLPVITDSRQWSKAQQGACSYYNNDAQHSSYGCLYNWHAISDNRNIAPEGWHIPTAAEVAVLVNSLQGDTVAGGYMKTMKQGYWQAPSEGDGMENGFAALPGGYRSGDNGQFYTRGSNGYWWHTTGSYELFAWTKRFFSTFADIRRDTQYYTYGFAVRCVKD